MTFGTFTPRMTVNNLSPLVSSAYAEIEAASNRALRAIDDRYHRAVAELTGTVLRHANGWEAHLKPDGSMAYFDDNGVCRMRMGVF